MEKLQNMYGVIAVYYLSFNSIFFPKYLNETSHLIAWLILFRSRLYTFISNDIMIFK